MDINIAYDPTKTNELCSVIHSFGSDKGKPDNTAPHNYTTFYHELFKNVRNDKLRIFEFGIGTTKPEICCNMGVNGRPGASLRAWKYYFPNASMFSADIDRDILFSEPRIQTFYCDQLNPEIINQMWSSPELAEEFDIFIDDGLHMFDANVCLFENSFQKIKKGGVYIIEDVRIETVELWNSKLELWKSSYPTFIFKILTIPHTNNIDNRLILAQRIY